MFKNLLKKDRMVSQDIAKGIAIILVTLVHSVKVNSIIGSIIAVLFGYIMPFYFFMSGYNYNDKGLSIKENLSKRIKKVLIPFLITSIIIFFIMGTYYYFIEDYSIKEILKSFLIFLMSKWSLGYLGWEFNQVMFQRVLGPCWFIQFMIIADLIFIPVHYYTKNSDKRLLISIIILSSISILLISLGIVLPWGIQNSFAIASLFLIANYIKRNNLLFNKKSNKLTIINCIITVIIIAVIQLLKNGAGYFGAGELGKVLGGIEVLVFYLIAIIGSYLLINISRLLVNTKNIKNFFVYVGQNSFIILMIHMSIVHLIKAIFNLPEWNAADSLFGTMDIREIIVYPLTIVTVIFFTELYKKLLVKIF